MHLRNWSTRPAAYAPFKTDCKTALLFLLAPAILLAAFWPASIWAAQVTLAWDPNDPAPQEYRLYQAVGNDAFNTTPAWRGSQTSCTLNDLQPATRYRFVVRAFADGIESGDSNQVTYRTPPAATPPEKDPTDQESVTGGAPDPNPGNSDDSSDSDQSTIGNPSPPPHPTPPSNPNRAPIADAGEDRTVSPGTRVTLNGTASTDPDGDPLAFNWQQTDGPAVRLYQSQTTRPSFTAPAAVSASAELTFQLTVRDPHGLSAEDLCRITVPAAAPPAEPPNAQAGDNRTVASGSRVQLNGSASVHPLGLPLTYQWIQTAGPTVVMKDAETAWPSFTAPTVAADDTTTLVFEMTVTDARQLACSDTCLVVVTGPPPGAIPDTTTADGGDGSPADESSLPGPAQPIIYYPADGVDNVTLTPWLSASEFSDPNCSGSHVRTQWHIAKAGPEQAVAMDVVRIHRPLKRLWVPFFALAPDTSYTCRVRYYGGRGQVSEWSAPVRFTTRGSWFVRNDAVMAYNTPPPPDSDLNANGIPDREESDRIQAVQTADGRHTMAVSIHDGRHVQAIGRIAAIDPQTVNALPVDAATLPYDLLAYRLELDRPGSEVGITIHLSDPIDPHAPWLVYGADGQWTEADPETLQVSEDGLTVLRTITDGGTEDVDGAVNGVVIDHLGPTESATTTATPGKSLDGGGESHAFVKGCLVDTLLP